MSASGTYTWGTTQQADDLMIEAYARCGLVLSRLEEIHVKHAILSLNYLFTDWANDGPNLWTIDIQTQALASGTVSYNLPAGTVDILEATIRDSDSNDRIISRISRAEYMALHDKDQSGAHPNMFYVDRQITPVIYLYPVADNATHTLRYTRLVIQEDVTRTLTQTLDAPNRWMEAIAAGLAAKLAVKFAGDRLEMLEAQAARAVGRAKMEDRERVPLRIYPDMAGMGV